MAQPAPYRSVLPTPAPPPPSRPGRRIVGIDLTRSAAICGAMLSHVAVVSGFGFQGDMADDLFKLALQASAPIFIVLFGTMLELAYLPRFTGGNRADVAGRLLARAMQCFALYALSVVALMVAWPGYSLPFSLATVLLMGVTPFTDILKFYAIVLAAAPLLLMARVRWGLRPIAVAAILLHVAWPILAQLPSPAQMGLPKEVDRALTSLIEVGSPESGGPSVVRGLSLVVAGMVFGRALTLAGRGADALRRQSMRIACAAGVVLAAVIVVAAHGGLAGLTDMSLRQAGHPLYYAINLPVAMLVTSIAVAATAGHTAKGLLHRLCFFGRTSLFTFAFGNILLYLTPSQLAKAHPGASTLILIAAVAAMSWGFDRLMSGTSGLAAAVRRVQAAFVRPARRIVRALA